MVNEPWWVNIYGRTIKLEREVKDNWSKPLATKKEGEGGYSDIHRDDHVYETLIDKEADDFKPFRLPKEVSNILDIKDEEHKLKSMLGHKLYKKWLYLSNLITLEEYEKAIGIKLTNNYDFHSGF